MKASPHRSCERGSALITAAVAAAVLAIMVSGVMSYIGSEHVFNIRSHRWTQALHLAEGGIEIGFAELNYQVFRGRNYPSSARGWTSLGGGTYTKTVSNWVDTAGNVVGTISITLSGISSLSPPPTSPYILAVGTCATTPRGPTISRAVKVRLQPSTKFPVAMMSLNKLDLNGNNVYTDSFDSSDPTKSTNGRYDSAKKQANGDIASNDTVTNSVDIGNADIYGTASTGPGGTVKMGKNGSVGPTFVSSDRADTVAAGVAKGWIRNDFKADVPAVTLPTGLSSAANLGNISGNWGFYGSGDYRANGISLSSGDTVTFNGNTRIYVTGNISISGNAKIVIAPGCTLEIYAAGSVAIAGNGVVNTGNTATSCQFYGLPTSTSWSLSGNGVWVGTVYAPQADLSLNGGGANGDMSGSIVAKSITLNGQVQFHYDEALRSGNLANGYNVAQWQALRYEGGSWIAE